MTRSCGSPRVDAVPAVIGPAGPGWRPRRRLAKLHGDKGDDYPTCRMLRRGGSCRGSPAVGWNPPPGWAVTAEGGAVAGLVAGQPAPDDPLRTPRRHPDRVPAPSLRADLRPRARTTVSHRSGALEFPAVIETSMRQRARAARTGRSSRWSDARAATPDLRPLAPAGRRPLALPSPCGRAASDAY
jgi:hypothetical protein